jgi:hypothetical protein
MILHIRVWLAVAAGGFTIAATWLLFGRWISLALDKCVPGRGSPIPHEPLLIEFDPAGISSRFTLGSQNWPLSWPTLPGPAELEVATDRQARLALRTGARWFTFGPVQKCWDDPLKPQYQFVSEADDVVSFTREISRIAWPTPFTFNLLGGATPSWKRFSYDRLRWRKTSGAALEVVWRSELWFYPRTGWADNYQRRLTRVRIRCSPIEKAVATYLSRTRGWTASAYRLESQPDSSTQAVVAAIHVADEAAAQPGSGQSVILRVDKTSGKVIGETAFQ